MEKRTRLISVVGKKHCGKTTLVVALAAEFVRQGKRVGTLKHGTHPANVDHEGTDTWRHFHEGLAERVLIESSGQRVLFQRLEEESDPVALARQFMVGTDIVIAEGFTRSTVPKIEVFRCTEHEKPHFDPARPNAADWFVMITDSDEGTYPFPTLKFSDTAWLMTLTGMAWRNAMSVEE